jgi:hypothetical protein
MCVIVAPSLGAAADGQQHAMGDTLGQNDDGEHDQQFENY